MLTDVELRTSSDKAKNATLPKFAGARELAETRNEREDIMMGMDESPEQSEGDRQHLSERPCSCIWCVGDRARKTSATEFVAANDDWREFARGWSGL